MKNSITKILLVLFLIAGFFAFGNLLISPSHTKAIDLPNNTYTINPPVVQTYLVGEDQDTAAVQVFWNLPDGSEPDAYGFILCKAGPVAATADKQGHCSTGQAQAANYYPSASGFSDLTNSGYYYDEAVAEGDTYTYHVKAYDRSGVESDFGQASVKIEFDFFKNIQTSNLNTTTSTITWDTVSEASNSTIEYGTTTTYGTTANATATNDGKTSFKADLTNLTDGTIYHFRLNANRVSDNKDVQSDDQTFTTAEIPFGISMGDGALRPTSADFIWTTSAPASCSPGGSGPVTNFAYTMSGLLPATSHSLTINCTRSTDSSKTVTKVINFTTPCTDMTSFSINTHDYYKEAKVSWTSPSDIHGVMMYRVNGSTDNWSSIEYSGADPNFIIPNLTPVTTYSYNIFSGTNTAPDGSCIAKSGTFTTENPWLALSVDSSTPTSARVHWKSNTLVRGNIYVNTQDPYFGILKQITTIPVDTFTKDTVIDIPLPLFSSGTIFDGNYNNFLDCSSLATSNKTLVFTADGIASDGNTLNYNPAWGSRPALINRPFVRITGHATFTNNVIYGNLTTTSCPSYTNYYSWSSANITTNVIYNNGGAYITYFTNTRSSSPNGSFSLNAVTNAGDTAPPTLVTALRTVDGHVVSATVPDSPSGPNTGAIGLPNTSFTPITYTVSAETDGSPKLNYSNVVVYTPTMFNPYHIVYTYYDNNTPSRTYPGMAISITYGNSETGTKSSWTYPIQYDIPIADNFCRDEYFVDTAPVSVILYTSPFEYLTLYRHLKGYPEPINGTAASGVSAKTGNGKNRTCGLPPQ